MQKKLYFKVRLSYDTEAENPTIPEEDLPRVLWAFANKTDVILSCGAFRGKDIISVLPDYGAMLGYHRGAKLDVYSFKDYRIEFGDKAERKIGDLRLLLKEARDENNYLEQSKTLLLK